MWSDDPNWQLTGLFLLALAVTGFVMKLIALLLPVTSEPDRPHVFWLLLSPSSHARLRPMVNLRVVLFRISLLCGCLVVAYWIYGQLVDAVGIGSILMSYCAAPILLLVSETLLAIVTLLWLPSGQLLPAIHNRPWLARSVADFWGRRWNLWFSDWFRYAIFQRLRRRPVFALALAFAVSGVLHEWVINVPLYFVTGRVLFGTMMLYFLLQAVGVLVERRFKNRPILLMTFAWFVVFAPAPLVLNEGLLRTMHLWPEPTDHLGSQQPNRITGREQLLQLGSSAVPDDRQPNALRALERMTR
ncbi:MAG: membrane bound O-acyl transferase family-domain-containing protein [Verrucomicrobiales bacterium]